MELYLTYYIELFENQTFIYSKSHNVVLSQWINETKETKINWSRLRYLVSGLKSKLVNGQITYHTFNMFQKESIPNLSPTTWTNLPDRYKACWQAVANQLNTQADDSKWRLESTRFI